MQFIIGSGKILRYSLGLTKFLWEILMDNIDSIDEEKLEKLAKLAISSGVALKSNQNLLLTAPIEALPLVRKVVKEAYESGAGLVTPLFSDPSLTLARYKYAKDHSFDKSATWLYKGMAEAFDENTARLAIVGDDPMLLSAEDPQKVSRANKSNSIAYSPARERITQFKINWSIIPWPSKSWAKRVFPKVNSVEAQKKLANAIFKASRIDVADPIKEWELHNFELHKKSSWLTKQNFLALQFLGPETELTVGLAEGHEWVGGATTAENGITCNPNIPSEEVFTTPHAFKVDGHVVSTKPLSHQGTLIDKIKVKFEKGKIVEASATKGEEVLLKLLSSDEGARRLGEVALVPDSSPISQSGLLFYNTLFDENAASHIALGQCYSKCFKGANNLSKEEITHRGGNTSVIHVDWMIGSKEIDINGVHQDGSKTPIFRSGEWVR